MKLIFASANQNKANEIRKMLPEGIELLTLADIDIKEDIPETSHTIKGNAIQKADYLLEHYKMDCFADDTGLEIEVLNGEPGVYSARYAGEERSDDANMDLVLSNLSNETNRKARFLTVIALNLNGVQHLFEGIVTGTIRTEKKGEHGFGYDPLFEPEDCGKTFAEMTMDEKNQYSHRARAVKEMINFLHTKSKETT